MVEDNKNNTLTWWEKTVEYAFVVENSKGLAIAPLDGRLEESFSDTVIKNGGKFSLIEFKRDKGCLGSERGKYDKYDIAEKELKDYSENCHYLIYGTDSKTDFLKAQGYFSGTEITIKEILKQGVCCQFFEEYLAILAEYKKRGGSGNGLSSVAFIINVENTAQILTLPEMMEAFPFLELDPAQDQDQVQDLVSAPAPAPGA
ncbi:hypothetical protein SPONN_596 [uncultured Candidatus Thioglobus sp.]|nr:hypothetical protein SPONN_596 [uncultured Candidatus Thioglobus sp.]